ncbi:Oidioi.mRNA.OKI2018_I69.XSR.g14675.t1.cds [Oikopleura dioica]|uniref:Ubiquitin carboxyl-terminal hydrolase n=1 Tax=Oikopleura dioica TaxID=34765 RepID=A0ABN7SEG0_OIKDI|nr:Oidioi.mRNA.OKI2018_I69.XSR.g14675.t1.cds [Oikopleura dioica]
MGQFDVNIKWGKEKFNDITVNTDEAPEIFKAQLFALTNVPPERQKIMIKGGVLKDSWDNFQGKLKNGAMIMLMGSADPLPEKPKELPRFMEDMADAEMNQVAKIPVGIENLGNTCYLNSVIQCLRVIPELKTALQEYSQSDAFVKQLKDLWNSLDNSPEAAKPIAFLLVLHANFPIFAERGPQGGLKQQDANEAWLSICRYLHQLPGAGNKDLMEELFGVQYRSETKCIEEGGETEAKVETDKQLSISCFIDTDVKYLLTGLKKNLVEKIEKKSEKLDRQAQYEKNSTIERLPHYLAVNFIRFYYKTGTQNSAKILKDVKFQTEFDAWDLCGPNLQEKLKPNREKLKLLTDKELDLLSRKKKNGVRKIEPPKYTQFEKTHFDEDHGSNNHGWYTLKAVLTHKGRSIDGGHYIAWTKQEDGRWIKFDDDKATVVTEEEVLALSGGGDWHTAYICIFETKKLPVFTPDLENDQMENMETS